MPNVDKTATIVLEYGKEAGIISYILLKNLRKIRETHSFTL